MNKPTKSVEDYLEAILIAEIKFKQVKATHISDFLEISRPAVTKALKLLEKEEYIIKQGTSIVLSKTGRSIAEGIYSKHLKVKEFLIKLGVPKNIAEIDCCKIEHCISPVTFEKIKLFCE